jgi:hypothetical protein
VGLFSPWFLAGLVTLGLPLWLHLLRQFKRTPQPFSSLMFFERRIQSSSKHRRLRYLALLLMRLALLALLVLLFANPFVNRATATLAPRKLTVIAVDRSFSMRYRNRMADAKEEAIQFINALPGGSSVQLLAVDAHAVPFTQPGTDHTSVEDAIRSMEVTDEASSYGELIRALRVMEQTTGLSLDVHLFTDAQQTSMPAAFSDLQPGPHTSLTVHEIGTGAAPNWAVQSVSIPAITYDAANVRLTAGIAGWQTNQVNRTVSVLLDGRTVASKDIVIPSSGRAEVEFNDLTIPFGVHRGQVELAPHDDLPNDDTMLFSIERADPRKVLFLTTPGRTAESFFYKSALDASTATGLRAQAAAIPEAARLDLSQFALVVLNNPGELDNSTTQALSNYLSNGGSVFIAAGPATSRETTVPLAGEHITATANSQGAQVKIFDLFATNVFDNVQFLSTSKITPQPSDRVLATFTDGSPLLLEQAKGEGRILIFAGTTDNTTSDFPVHAGFVPFVAATGAYLTGETNAASSVTVGSAVALRQSKSQTASADVIGPNGKHEFPLSEGARIMSFNPASEGFYDVHSANGKRRLLAVHADRRESNLEKVPAETLILWRNTSNGGAVKPGTETESGTVQVSLWRYLLTFVLIAAIVESIFASRYLTEERQAS